MENINSTRLLTSLAIFAVAASPAWVLAHGPLIPISLVNGKIVTNQFDFTPVKNSSNVDSYPVGAEARVFPSQFNTATVFDNTATGGGKSPANAYVVPLLLNSAGGNTGYYGELETKDGNGSATLHTGPGLAFSEGGFAATTKFLPVFTDVALHWNGSSFQATPYGERIRITSSSVSTSSFSYTYSSPLGTPGSPSNGGDIVGTATGPVTSAAGTAPGNHKQYAWSLVDALGASNGSSIADGIYLASLKLTAIDPNLTGGSLPGDSLPYYILFEKNASGAIKLADEQAAAAYVATVVVPEPGIMLSGIVPLMTLRRRR
jgi:hypothetical protein